MGFIRKNYGIYSAKRVGYMANIIGYVMGYIGNNIFGKTREYTGPLEI